MQAVLPDWAFFPAELDYFLRRSRSGDASVDISGDVGGDVSGDVSISVSSIFYAIFVYLAIFCLFIKEIF